MPVELHCHAVGSPDGRAELTVTERHRLVGLGVGLAEHDVGTAHDPGRIDGEVTRLPGGRRARRSRSRAGTLSGGRGREGR
jgi:hypothetical protein